MKSYFRSSGYLKQDSVQTDSGKNLDVSALPAFLRTLLVMDGTVTKSLEAWAWEPVAVTVLNNQLGSAEAEGLNLKQGETVLSREVALVGEHSRRVHACARSVVAIEQLPEKIRQSLINGKIGIGELLREQGFETYRDIFGIDYLDEVDPADLLLSRLTPPVVSRSYRIRLSGSPAIVVTEYFPVAGY